MARPLRIEFPNAIYHVMARGNGRQAIFHEPEDYGRMCEGLEKTIGRTGWQVFAWVWMPNHIHLLLKTPQPNLSKGMQYLLSGYANWYAKRHRRSGHLFQGRFRGELIEGDSYYWTVSRYIHLNSVRGKRPLVVHPRNWEWSSYPGYCDQRKRNGWLAYDELLRAWQGEMGGSNTERAYRRFVEAGIKQPPSNPLREAIGGWLLGSESFVNRIKRLVSSPDKVDQIPKARALKSPSAERVIATVAKYFHTHPQNYQQRRSLAEGRDLAAWFAHRRTTATLRELAVHFGLNHPDSVCNLIRRAQRAIAESKQAANDINRIDKLLN